jgi:hypothetical protein
MRLTKDFLSKLKPQLKIDILSETQDMGDFVEIDSNRFKELVEKNIKTTKFGLGDAVAALASPIAAASDSMFGTSLSSCGGCAKRREALNQMVPSIIPTLSP